MPCYAVLNLFFTPTCSVFIYDRVTDFRQKVENVPWGLGVTAGLISQIGDVTTREIEKTFSLPDDLKYHKTGSVMASNLIANARQFRITNEDVRDSMKSFISQCVVYDAMLGVKYTFDDLKSSKDIWGLVSENASKARSFLYKAPGKSQLSEIVTCHAGAQKLDPLLKQQTENAFRYFEGKLFGARPKSKPTPPGQELKQYLPGAFNYMGEMSKNATDHMMQQIMIHTVMDSIESKSTELGNAHNFAVRRAYLQQRKNQETLAGIASQKLVAMKNVMESLIYAAFIFILPLALLPFGWRFIQKWIGLMMWVQMWPPLYAILNFVANVSVRSRGIGMIADPSGTGITIANSVGFMDLHADMAAQAGFMSIAVGSLAYALVKGGAASFVHLASHMAGPSVSAAATASDSLMSGNYSFGNLSQGTVSAYNTSLGHSNDSASYNSGAFAQNDGIVSRMTAADGTNVVGVSGSNLRETLSINESKAESYQEQADQRAQFGRSEMVSSGKALSEANRQTAELSERQAKSASSGDTYTLNENASQTRAFTKLDGLVDSFASANKLDKGDAAKVLASVSANLETGIGFKAFGNGVSARLGTNLTGQKEFTEVDSKTWSAAKDFSKQNNLQEAFNNARQASQDTRYSETDDKSKSLAKSINASYESSQQHREEANKSFQQSESFSKTASYLKTNSGQINQVLNQEFVDWLPQQSLPNSKGSMGMKEAETILSSRPELNHQYQQKFMEQKMTQIESLANQRGMPSSMEAVQTSYKDHNIGSNISNEGHSTIHSQAEAQGLGDAFALNHAPKYDVKDQMERIQDQIAEQTEMLEKEAQIRETGFGK